MIMQHIFETGVTVPVTVASESCRNEINFAVRLQPEEQDSESENNLNLKVRRCDFLWPADLQKFEQLLAITPI